jgi:hypothetical protein
MWDGPAIILHGKEEKTCLLIDTAIRDDSKVDTKETEKLRKDEDREIEVSRMRKVRSKIVPVITGARGRIKEGLDQNLQLLPGHPSAIELQKAILMSTAHVFRKVLM